MDSLKIAEEYYDGVKKLIGDITMVLYGSTVFGVKTSDLDLCFICKEPLPLSQFDILKEFTHDFHLKKNLRIDEEVPYDNKLVYTYDFIESALTNSPFPFYNGKYVIPSIEKNSEFLNSLQMKKRLLLNILTVKHIIIGRDESIIDDYADEAWEVILRTIISYSEKSEISFESILNLLYSDPFNYNTGEMYLGYKENLPEKVEYIKEQLSFQVDRLTREKKLIKTLSKTYFPNQDWLINGKSH